MSLPDLKLSRAKIESLPVGAIDWEDIEGTVKWGGDTHQSSAAKMNGGIGVQPYIIRTFGAIKVTPKYYYVIDSYGRDGDLHYTRIPRANVKNAIRIDGGRL